ncbi:MAG: ATP-dependent helicase [Pseudonocardia sp.]|nr:ATP-dependent helicase [Pseudonocardia sp.]
MPPRRPSTTEQKLAAAHLGRNLLISASPGSGKTHVASERFGVLRFSKEDGRRVLGLSFTRSATAELRKRISKRWGSHALAWPHTVQTIDAAYCEVVEFLINSQSIHWLNLVEKLTVLDTWRGQRGCRYLAPGNQYRRIVRIRNAKVITAGRRVTHAGYGIGTKAAHDQLLKAGICTHDEIRDIVHDALRNSTLRESIATMLRTTTRAVILDEVFDANQLDLEFVRLLVETGIDVTLVGDPWQALYEFRGAQPGLVEDLTLAGFDTTALTGSFRFETEQMRIQASRLRAGLPVSLSESEGVEQTDIILGTHWKDLWSIDDAILPLSFGSVDNKTDALIILLLDQALRDHFGVGAIYAAEAASVLGIPSEIFDARRLPLFRNALDLLMSDSNESPKLVLADLRSQIRDIGSPGIVRRLSADSEEIRVGRLKSIRERLQMPSPVLAMTVHQAKGREWQRVGVLLQDSHLVALERGLRLTNATDRLLYVALTRARSETTLLRAG